MSLKNNPKILLVCDSHRLIGSVIDFAKSVPNSDLIVITTDQVITEKMKSAKIKSTFIQSPVRDSRVILQRQFIRLEKISIKLKLRWLFSLKELIFGFLSFFCSLRERQIAAEILSNFRPDAILLESDRSLGLSAVFLSVNQEFYQTRVFLLISAIVDLDGTIINREKKPATWTENLPLLINDLIHSKYSLNTKKNAKHKYRHFFSLAEIIYLKLLNVLPPNPWTVGSLPYVKVLTPNTFQKNLLSHIGTAPSRIHNIGSPEMQRLYLNNRDKIADKKKSQSKISVYISLPQLLEHGICSAEEHWNQISCLRDLSRLSEFETTYFLHPRMDKEIYTQFLPNCKISDERLIDCISDCDVFVASYSSTVPWAILCNSPAVIIDLTGINSGLYNDFPSIYLITQADKLAECIKNAATHPVDEMSKLLAGDDVFDDQFGSRIVKLIEEHLN